MQQKIMTLQEDFKNPNQIKAIMFDIFNGHGVKTEFHKKILFSQYIFYADELFSNVRFLDVGTSHIRVTLFVRVFPVNYLFLKAFLIRYFVSRKISTQ